MSIKKILSFIFPSKKLEETKTSLSKVNYKFDKIWNNDFIGLPHEIIPNFIDWEIGDNCFIWIICLRIRLKQLNIDTFDKIDDFFTNYSTCKYPITFNKLSDRHTYSISFTYQGVNDLNELIFKSNYIEEYETSNMLFTIPINFFELCKILEYDEVFVNTDLRDRYRDKEIKNKQDEHLEKNKNIEEQLKNSEYNNFLTEYKKSLQELNS